MKTSRKVGGRQNWSKHGGKQTLGRNDCGRQIFIQAVRTGTDRPV